MKSNRTHHIIVLSILLILLALPVVATLFYALASSWGATLLPDSLTTHWFTDLWQETRFQAAFMRSLWICLLSLLLSVLVIFPVVFVVHQYFPRLKNAMNIIVVLPFAIPPVVSSVGLLELYSSGPIVLTNTPWILVFCYFIIALPFIYKAMDNNFQALNLTELTDAAKMLGAGTMQAIWQVVLPNMQKGILVAVFLSFSFLIGEFLFANILVGSGYETLQVYLYGIRQKSGHFSAAVVITYFLLIFVSTWLANRLSRH